VNELRIHPRGPVPDQELLKRYRAVPAAALSDALGRNAAVVGLSPVGDCLSGLAGASVAGPALTVRTRPGDNLALHKALDLAQPGDVVVVDARGDLYSSVMGDLMTRYAGARRVAAVVIDGAVRDRAVLSAGTVPVFARGFSHIAPAKLGPGEISAPISVGGVPVRDGDLVIGDEDGVTVVPRELAESALAAAERIVAGEAETRAAIDAGTWDRSWVDRAAAIVEVPGG
jgi:regulator of RNase E activity RraA